MKKRCDIASRVSLFSSGPMSRSRIIARRTCCTPCNLRLIVGSRLIRLVHPARTYVQEFGNKNREISFLFLYEGISLFAAAMDISRGYLAISEFLRERRIS